MRCITNEQFCSMSYGEKSKQNKKSGRHTHFHITLSTFIGISWRHFVVCCALLLSLFSFAAADEFQIRRHIVFEVVATRRFQFFVSRDCIFVDLLKPYWNYRLVCALLFLLICSLFLWLFFINAWLQRYEWRAHKRVEVIPFKTVYLYWKTLCSVCIRTAQRHTRLQIVKCIYSQKHA